MKCPKCHTNYLFDRFGPCKRCGFDFNSYYLEQSHQTASNVTYQESLATIFRNIPTSVWMLSLVLAALRIYLFTLIHAKQSHDAQWQLIYLPLWIIDFPASIGYFVTPIPFGEAFVGPVWWFSIPIIVWKWRKNRRTTDQLQNQHPQ